MALLTTIRNRTFFIGLVALLLAIWLLRTAFHIAGAAMRFILIIAAVLFAIGWITRKVGRGR